MHSHLVRTVGRAADALALTAAARRCRLLVGRALWGRLVGAGAVGAHTLPTLQAVPIAPVRPGGQGSGSLHGRRGLQAVPVDQGQRHDQDQKGRERDHF
jgi:hypothetical protein